MEIENEIVEDETDSTDLEPDDIILSENDEDYLRRKEESLFIYIREIL